MHLEITISAICGKYLVLGIVRNLNPKEDPMAIDSRVFRIAHCATQAEALMASVNYTLLDALKRKDLV